MRGQLTARRIYGFAPTDDGQHFMFVSLDARTGAERVINENLGTMPQASSRFGASAGCRTVVS